MLSENALTRCSRMAFHVLGSRRKAAVSSALRPPSTVFLDWDECESASKLVSVSGRGRKKLGSTCVPRFTVCVPVRLGASARGPRYRACLARGGGWALAVGNQRRATESSIKSRVT